MNLPTAKVFTTGNSQAVRLPKAFRVSTREMWITKNEVTGEIILRPKDDDQRQRNLDALFRMIEQEPFSEDFIPARPITESRNPLAEWAEPLPHERSAGPLPSKLAPQPAGRRYPDERPQAGLAVRPQAFSHSLEGPGAARVAGALDGRKRQTRKSDKP